MARLPLSIAVGDYDRTRALVDGTVPIDGVDPVCLTLTPEEMFFRAFRHQAFDVTELSFSSYCVKLAQGDCPYVAIPAFVSRAFRHTSIWVRRDRVKAPADLRGRRVGIPEWQLTAIVWARALLADDFGVLPQDVTWVRGGIDEPGRPEKIPVALPPGVRVAQAPEGDTLSAMLERGDLDGFIAPRAPCRGQPTHPDIGWLFPDPTAAAKDYYARTGIFPIMHVVGVRKTLVDRHPWLPGTLLKAFEGAKAAALAKLADTSATKVTLPFVEEQLAAARALLGPDFWSYGVAANRRTLEAFVRHHHAQGLSARPLSVDELFHPSTVESTKV